MEVDWSGCDKLSGNCIAARREDKSALSDNSLSARRGSRDAESGRLWWNLAGLGRYAVRSINDIIQIFLVYKRHGHDLGRMVMAFLICLRTVSWFQKKSKEQIMFVYMLFVDATFVFSPNFKGQKRVCGVFLVNSRRIMHYYLPYKPYYLLICFDLKSSTRSVTLSGTVVIAIFIKVILTTC